MAWRPRLVALDIDGTLLSSTDGCPDRYRRRSMSWLPQAFPWC